MGRIIVVGGGAAGMMAAITAARNGNTVTLYEKNEKLGKKLFITGKGRCNVTNATDCEQLLSNVISNPKFLYSAFTDFDAQACMDFFEEIGVRLKVERGNRVFPQSDHSSDIIKALSYEMRRLSVTVCLNTEVTSLAVRQEEEAEHPMCCGVYVRKTPQMKPEEMQKVRFPGEEPLIVSEASFVQADKVILATGGISYPLTGADGRGLFMASESGHRVTALYPALVPLVTKEAWCRELMGLSLRNVGVMVKKGKKQLFEGFGEMLFTHFGVSGPLILSASSRIGRQLEKGELSLLIDLKPALTAEQLDKRLLRDFEQAHNKQFKNALGDLLPSRLIPVVIMLSGISPDKKVHEISKAERLSFVALLKALPLTIVGTTGFREAIIMQGGISVKDINPSTMESKKVDKLFFAGECVDVDALTGGFNLQIAWATGHLAGSHV